MICPDFSLTEIFYRNGYHGASPYTMGMTAVGTWKFNHPVGFGIHQVTNCNNLQRPGTDRTVLLMSNVVLRKVTSVYNPVSLWCFVL